MIYKYLNYSQIKLFFLLKNFKFLKLYIKKYKTIFPSNSLLPINNFIFIYPLFYFPQFNLNFINKIFFLYYMKNALQKKALNFLLDKDFLFHNFNKKSLSKNSKFLLLNNVEFKINSPLKVKFKCFLVNYYYVQQKILNIDTIYIDPIFFVFIFKKFLKISFQFEFFLFNYFSFKNYNYSFKVSKFVKFMINLNDKHDLNLFENNLNFFSNKYLIEYFNFYDDSLKPIFNFRNRNIYNNYYPIVKSNYILHKYFSKKFKFNRNIEYILFTNKIVVKFLEIFLKKKIFIKVLNNNFYKIKNNYFNVLVNDYKNFKPAYFKKSSIAEFIEILWYSFLLKDLKMLSNWITKFMELLIFKNHKKFLSFFNNFLNKYSSMFIDVLGIKGFFFDIRGKVGVTGSSKKRHLCFKFGSIKKSSKKNKINFNQNLVRTYSGVMGLTYIINY